MKGRIVGWDLFVGKRSGLDLSAESSTSSRILILFWTASSGSGCYRREIMGRIPDLSQPELHQSYSLDIFRISNPELITSKSVVPCRIYMYTNMRYCIKLLPGCLVLIVLRFLKLSSNDS